MYTPAESFLGLVARKLAAFRAGSVDLGSPSLAGTHEERVRIEGAAFFEAGEEAWKRMGQHPRFSEVFSSRFDIRLEISSLMGAVGAYRDGTFYCNGPGAAVGFDVTFPETRKNDRASVRGYLLLTQGAANAAGIKKNFAQGRNLEGHLDDGPGFWAKVEDVAAEILARMDQKASEASKAEPAPTAPSPMED